MKFPSGLNDPNYYSNYAYEQPTNNIGIVNLEQKKKPYDVKIKNNSDEPKVKANTKYTDKQNYRRYKTKIEPNLLSKILVNEDDDIVNKIKEALGIKIDNKNSNFIDVETSPAPYQKGPDMPTEPINRMDEIDDIPLRTREELTLQSDPDYHFNFEETPVKRMSRRERELNEELLGSLPDEANPLMAKLSTPGERELLNRLSLQRTPPARVYRTPEISRKMNEEFDKFFENVSAEKNITKRKSGRPEGTYGPIKRIQDAIDRTPEENIAYFKSRKNINKNLPQKSIRELTDKRNKDEYKLNNFVFGEIQNATAY